MVPMKVHQQEKIPKDLKKNLPWEVGESDNLGPTWGHMYGSNDIKWQFFQHSFTQSGFAGLAHSVWPKVIDSPTRGPGWENVSSLMGRWKVGWPAPSGCALLLQLVWELLEGSDAAGLHSFSVLRTLTMGLNISLLHNFSWGFASNAKFPCL